MNYFLDPIKKHYADFKGRATRKQFWMFTLIQFIIGYILALASVAGKQDMGLSATILFIIFILFALLTLIPSLAIAARRLHDAGHSGLMYLLGFIPFIGVIILLVLFCSDSQKGANKWGPNPKGIN
ncbi:MAG: hypothetical protein RI945_386 [Candidatus Parcubacteria bacterium]|jgi:uncharacterized membrane protein YhaH (DUF805 family)